MATTEQILAAARSLGQLIQQHDVAQRMEQALKALQDDVESQRLLADYNRHLSSLAEKEAAGQPIEVEDKRQLDTLQKKVIASSNLQKFQVAQMDYLDLMRRVDEQIAGDSPAAESPLAGPNLDPNV